MLQTFILVDYCSLKILKSYITENSITMILFKKMVFKYFRISFADKYTCLKIYLYKKALFIFVNNIIFFSMLYHGTDEYVANTWICVYMIVK